MISKYEIPVCLVTALLLTSCNGNQNMQSTEPLMETNQVVESETVTELVPTAPPAYAEPTEELAKQYFSVAFNADLTNVEMDDSSEPPHIFQFYPDPDDPNDNYYIDFRDNSPYPESLFHSNHPNIDGIDIAKEEVAFNPDWIPAAQEFVRRVYDIDCSEAKVFAYRYQNKVAILFQVSEDMFFDVRFYWKDTVPTGCLFTTSEEMSKAIYNYWNATSFHL